MPVEQRAKYIRITLEKAYRLEKQVNEFFEITRYNLQEIILEKETIDLYYMLVQMTDEFYPILSAKGITAALHADENLTVYGDPAKLARVFNNILKNAAAYSYPNTEIVISAEEAEGYVKIMFQNQGHPIPPDKLAAIFEKFYRLDDARSTGTGGSGLGLAIAKEIVTLHGGTIEAHSRDNTVTFTVSLPVSH
jgi:two-component system sensor histidine kinase VanS